MAHKTTDEENYSGIIENGFEAYTVAFDEITSFVKENGEKKLDLTIRMEDFFEVKTQFSTVLKSLCGLGLPEKSLILRLPIGLTHFEDEELEGKYPFSEFEQSQHLSLSFIHKIVLPTTFNQSIRFDKKGVAIVVPSTLIYVVGRNFQTNEDIWSDEKKGYETYTVEKKYIELNEYRVVFDNIACFKSAESNLNVVEAIETVHDKFISDDERLEIPREHTEEMIMARYSPLKKEKTVATNNSTESVDAAVFASPAVIVNTPFIIHVAIFHHKDFDEIYANYTTLSDKSEKHANKTVSSKISENAKIDIKVGLKDSKGNNIGLVLKRSKKWIEMNIEEDFTLTIPLTYIHTSILGEAEILVNGEPACKMVFKFAVGTIFSEGFKILNDFLSTPTGKIAVFLISSATIGPEFTKTLLGAVS